MSDKVIVQRGGVTFLQLLQVLFIGLKLTGYVTWSWWVVFLPMLIPLGILFLVFGVFALIGICLALRG